MQGVFAAWQATADNRVTRHYTGADAADQVKIGKYRINGLRNRLVGASASIDNILRGLDEMDAVLAGAPSEELATAQQALVDLQRRNDHLVEQCRSWKQRAVAAEKQAEEALEQAQKQVKTPHVFFDRQGTPGDSVRYLAAEVMKHAEGNLELAGIAMALKMVAADVDSLPQGGR